MNRPTTPPEAAEQGDDCGILLDIGGCVPCVGTLEAWGDVMGDTPPPDPEPLVCNVCNGTVP